MLEIETEIKSEESYREWRSQWRLQMKEGETEWENLNNRRLGYEWGVRR